MLPCVGPPWRRSPGGCGDAPLPASLVCPERSGLYRAVLSRVAALVALVAVFACTRRLQVHVIAQADRGTPAPRPDTCEARWYEATEPLAASCREIGDVFVGDTGWTFDCAAERVRAEVRRQACLFGADAVQVIHDEEPSLFGSSCEQI